MAGENSLRKEIPPSSISDYEMYCDYKTQVIRNHAENKKVKSSVNGFAKYLILTVVLGTGHL